MSDTSPILSLPYLQPSQAQKHVTHNEALQILDVLVQTVVADRDQSAPPASPTAGLSHIVAAGGTGAWAGHDDEIATWDGTTWFFVPPRTGWQAQVSAEAQSVTWDGSAWGVQPPLLQNLEAVGINTTADAGNRLALSAPATLFSHAGAGHQLKINKSTGADTASLLFQTGWAGRAELGTAGTDDFTIKVSDDGASWVPALRIDAGSGRVDLPEGAEITGSLTGTAVQQSATDTTSGRLLALTGTKGAFGLGCIGGPPSITDMDAETCPTGFWRSIGSTTGTHPPGVTKFGVLRHERYDTNNQAQWFVPINADQVWTRRYKSGTWNAWRLVYDQASLLGPVSQSGGVPTGAVLERGSNANGTYVRWADGTQICTNANAAITIAPAAFTGTITKIDSDKLWIGTWV